MKVLVLGAGVMGITTAYELARRGHMVSVIDRQPGPSAETSFANGGQMSYSHAEPWATPGVLRKLPKWLIHEDSPLVVRPRADWRMMQWGAHFLRNCTTARAEANCVNILRLGLYSKRKFAELRTDTQIDFQFETKGTLHIYSSQKEFDKDRRQNDFQAKFGCRRKVLSREECHAQEPALAHSPRDIVGGLLADMDETGDTLIFCQKLAEHIAGRYGVSFHYGVTVRELKAEGQSVVAVATDHGDFVADAYVMALSAYSPLHLRKLGIAVPIYPMKGYSITIEADEFCPRSSITDSHYKIVYTRLGNRLRVAGTAEFAGYDSTINERRIAPIVRITRSVFPKANWQQPIEKWACLRPSTPDGVPILGKTPLPNLYLNTGHGTLGWTQAAGSAAIVADAIENNPPEIMVHGLTLGSRL